MGERAIENRIKKLKALRKCRQASSSSDLPAYFPAALIPRSSKSSTGICMIGMLSRWQAGDLQFHNKSL